MPKLFLALISPVTKSLTPVMAANLEGVAKVVCVLVHLAPPCSSGAKSRIYNFFQLYTDLNITLSHAVSHTNVGSVIKTVTFDFEYTSYR